MLEVEDRDGVLTYTVRDLRNNNIVHNVTRFSARHLWKYAITEREDNPLDESQVFWLGAWASGRPTSGPARGATTWCSATATATSTCTMASPRMASTASGVASWRTDSRMIKVAILTVSDRSSRGERPDASGPVIREMVTGQMQAR